MERSIRACQYLFPGGNSFFPDSSMDKFMSIFINSIRKGNLGQLKEEIHEKSFQIFIKPNQANHK